MNYSEMTKEQLLNEKSALEKQYEDLSPKQVSIGKTVVNRIVKNVVVPAAEEMGKQVVKSLMTKEINKYIDNDDLKVFTNNKKK